jgi:hypothetical protein
LHVGPQLSELTHRRRQNIGGHKRCGAERYGLSIALGAAANVGDRNIQLFKAALNDGEKLSAVGRQFDPTCGAVEQPEADATLQFFDQHARKTLPMDAGGIRRIRQRNTT